MAAAVVGPSAVAVQTVVIVVQRETALILAAVEIAVVFVEIVGRWM